MTWCLWLNGTGWSTGWPTLVTYGERTYSSSTTNRTPSPNNDPPSVNRAKLVAPGAKTCATTALNLASIQPDSRFTRVDFRHKPGEEVEFLEVKRREFLEVERLRPFSPGGQPPGPHGRGSKPRD